MSGPQELPRLAIEIVLPIVIVILIVIVVGTIMVIVSSNDKNDNTRRRNRKNFVPFSYIAIPYTPNTPPNVQGFPRGPW